MGRVEGFSYCAQVLWSEEPIVGECEVFLLVGAVSDRVGLPLLLFEKNGSFGGLRLMGQRYSVDKKVTFGPVVQSGP